MGKRKKSDHTDDTSQQTRRSPRKGKSKPDLKKVTKTIRKAGGIGRTKVMRYTNRSQQASTASKPRYSLRKAVVDLAKDTAVVDLKSGCSVVDFVLKNTTKKKKQTKGNKALESTAAVAAQIKMMEATGSSDGIQCSLIPSNLPSEQLFYTDDSSSSIGTDGTSSDDVYILDLDGKSAKGKGTRNRPHQSVIKQRKTPEKPIQQQQKDRSSTPRQRWVAKSLPAIGLAPETRQPDSVPTPRMETLKQEKSSDMPSTPEREMESDESEMEFMSDDSSDDGAEASASVVDEERNSAPFIPQATYQRQRARILPHTLPTHCVALIHPLSLLPFYGQVKVTIVHGEVKVHGYVLTAESKQVVVYSPKCSPALCLETSDRRTELCDEDTLRLREEICHLFKADSAELMVQEVMASVERDGAAVVVVEPHRSHRTDYVATFPKYGDLFEDNEHQPKWGKSKIQQQILSSIHNIGFFPVTPDMGLPILTNPPVYHYVSETMLQSVSQTGPPPVVMVCGWRNSGKSTFARYLINTILNKTGAVCFLDCDVGQTEFNPPTMLSLSVITQPLLGPPYTHEVKPERMCFYGDASPANSPDVYLGILRYLHQYYVDNLQHLPLVVNCMGWMIGLGLCLQIDLIRLMQPSHLFQLLPTPQPKRAPILNKEYLMQATGWSTQCADGGEEGIRNMKHMLLHMPWRSEEGRKYKAANYREMSLLSYLSQLVPRKETIKICDPLVTFDPLSTLTPFIVPWGAVGVHVCNAEVPPSQLMYALNGSVVGLCKADPKQMISIENANSKQLPKMFRSTPICECLGLGIVRGIDPINKMFYILSHLSESALKEVNALLKGSLALPQFILQQGQKTDTVVPYVTSEFLHEITGAGTIKGRYMVPKKQATGS